MSGPTNLDPIIETQNDTSAVVGQVLALRAVAHDPDGDPLNFRLTVFLTSGEIKAGYYPDVDFDENTGDFLFRPTVEDRPSRSFRFRVHDTRGGADSTEFAVTVN